MIVTNKYKCNKMFLKIVKCLPTKCKPSFGPPCILNASKIWTKTCESHELVTSRLKVL